MSEFTVKNIDASYLRRLVKGYEDGPMYIPVELLPEYAICRRKDLESILHEAAMAANIGHTSLRVEYLDTNWIEEFWNRQIDVTVHFVGEYMHTISWERVWKNDN